MKIKYNRLIGSTFFYLLIFSCFSQYSSSSDYKASLSASLSSTVQKKTKISREKNSSFHYRAHYPLSFAKLKHGIGINRNLTNKSSRFSLSNPYIGLSRALYKISEDSSLTGSSTISIPIVKSKRINGHKGSLAAQLSAPLNTKYQNLSFSFYLNGNYHFYEYKTAKSGEALNKASISYTGVAHYVISNDLSWSMGLSNIHLFDSFGNRSNDRFALFSGLDFAITKKILLNIEYSNQGSTFGPKQEHINLDIYNPENSEVSTSLTILF